MATLTPNIGLKKPAGSEYPKISDAVNDNADILDANIAKLQEGIAIIVDGDNAAVAVPVGGYAYIKNNQHELPDGLYKNTSSSAFPVSGGTANSTVFTAVPTGAVNDAVSALNNKIGNAALPTTAQTLTGAIAEHEQDITSQNDNIEKVQNGLAYIVGDTNTTGGTLAVGQFVYVKGHSTIAEGLRKVTASISANGSITTNNTEACPEGGLNALNSKFTKHLINTTISITSQTTVFYTGVSITIPSNSFFALYVKASYHGGEPKETYICMSSTQFEGFRIVSGGAYGGCSLCGYVSSETTYYIWAKYSNVSQNSIILTGWYESA